MFNNKLHRRVEDNRQEAQYDYHRLNDRYWELRRDVDLLATTLGLEKRVTLQHVDYVKNGGPGC